MKKKDAKQLLGLNNKELSDALHISESYIRNSNKFSDAISSHIEALAKIDSMQLKIDEYFSKIEAIQGVINNDTG